MSSIFVQIASYNDDELPKTIKDCIEKSSSTNEIFFGVHECYEDVQFVSESSRIRYSSSKAPKHAGVGSGRYLANKHYNGEDYYLQIDSHSRFMQNWDTLLIDNLEKHYSNGVKCVLSCYPARYWYSKKTLKEVYDPSVSPSNIASDFSTSVEIFREHRNIGQKFFDDHGEKCSAHVSAANIFGRGDIASVQQNPAVFYWGEEFLRAASLYTSGYNIMIPDIVVVYHLYGSDSDRQPIWTRHQEECSRLEEFSKVAIRTILSEGKIGPRELGSERSLEQYGRFVGVDFKGGIIL